jgi:hypothetical protein
LISFIFLLGLFARDFKSGSEKQEEFNAFVQPVQGKLIVNVAPSDVRYSGGDWFGLDEDFPVYGLNQDTLMLNTVRVNVVKSEDSLYHIHDIRFARGHNPESSLDAANKIQFDIRQKDSVLVLPKGFPISKEDKFRTQRVLVIIEVPIGKKIQLDRALNDYRWFNVNFDRNRGWNASWDENWDKTYYWENNVEYIMTEKGLRRTDRHYKDENSDEQDNDQGTEVKPKNKTNDNRNKNQYRYKGNDNQKPSTPDSSGHQKTSASNDPDESSQTYPSLIYMIAKMSR